MNRRTKRQERRRNWRDERCGGRVNGNRERTYRYEMTQRLEAIGNDDAVENTAGYRP